MLRIYSGLLLSALLCLWSNLVIAEKPLAPETVDGAQTIDTTKAKTLFEQGVPFIDVRKQHDYDIGHIPGAYHLPLASEFTEGKLATIVSKANPVVIYCNGIYCMGSSKATQQAVEWGWMNVYYYRDGMPDWELNNFPVNTLVPETELDIVLD
ncbi:MAG: rhodanese-like domain-containing protein [Nitrosomonas sp.]|nr:rhodanese-like domain-containing protein [Nitrosomonas sp.]